MNAMESQKPKGFKFVSQAPFEQSSTRVREALKHLPPWMPRSLPSPAQLPVSSPDGALNAFAQLVAFRLNVDRALISLLDDGEQYILTEATKTTPLLSNQSHDTNNGLILGMTAIPKNNGLCDCALKRTSTSEVWIVKNIHDDTTLCGRDFAQSRLEIRFYAACPIIVKGSKIGVLCVYDRLSRDTLATDEVELLVDMAATIAQHLESARAYRTHDRSLRMLAALDSGMKSTSGIRSSPRKFGKQHRGDKPPLSTATSALGAENTNAAQKTPHLPQEVNGNPLDTHFTARSQSPTQRQEGESPTPDKNLKSNAEKAGLNQASGTLEQAGSLFLNGFDADGIIFYDASSRGSKEHTLEPVLGTPSESDSSPSEDELSYTQSTSLKSSQTSQDDGPLRPSTCGILASSVSKRHLQTESATGHLREKDLQRLLRRYPGGKILHLGEIGVLAGSSGDDDDESTNRRDNAPRAGQNKQPLDIGDSFPASAKSSSPGSRDFKYLNVQKSKDRLSKAFPEAKSIAFFPLWDFHRERWYAGGFAYSCDVKRLIFSEDDLHFLKFFSLCIMGELAKRDWAHSELQKETFVSLISHELRTPLHGILSNCELMREIGLPPFQTTLLDTVDGCGHSLLDVINHLLDHSALVAKGERQKRSKHNTRKTIGLHFDQNADLEEPSEEYGVHTQEDIDLVAVTEEIIGGFTSEMQLVANTRQGFERQDVLNSPQRQNLNRSHVAIIYAIHPKDNWVLRLRTGAFRRVLTNLIGNSIKFTNEGTIQIALRRSDPKDGSSLCTVKLQVSDTGEGISDDFLKHHLFERFQQEDSHKVGNGLGLFIVRSIVDELRGTVDVQSQKGNDTVVTVAVPCELVVRSPPLEGSKPLHYLQNTLAKVKKATHGVAACFIGATLPNHESKQMKSLGYSMDAIAKICMEWYDLKIEHSDKLVSGNRRSVNFVDETYLYSRSFSDMQDEIEGSADRSDPEKPFYTPTVFVGTATFVAALHRDSAFRASDSQFFITNPCGPHQLGRILSLCMDCMPHRSLVPIETTIASRAAQLSPAPENRATPAPAATRPESQSVPENLPLAELSLSPTRPISTTNNDARRETKAHASSPSQDIPPVPSLSKEAQPDQASMLALPASLILPPNSLSQGQSHQASAPSLPSSLIQPPDPRPGPTMLLVEDNAINMKVLEVCVKRLSLPYSRAFNGSEAVSLFAASPLLYDIIWMDIMMPIMDGITATRQIRSLEKKSRRTETKRPVTVIALTGMSGEEIEGDARNVGMDAFFTKPIKGAILKKGVEEWVKEQSGGSASSAAEEPRGRTDKSVVG